MFLLIDSALSVAALLLFTFTILSSLFRARRNHLSETLKQQETTQTQVQTGETGGADELDSESSIVDADDSESDSDSMPASSITADRDLVSDDFSEVEADSRSIAMEPEGDLDSSIMESEKESDAPIVEADDGTSSESDYVMVDVHVQGEDIAEQLSEDDLDPNITIRSARRTRTHRHRRLGGADGLSLGLDEHEQAALSPVLCVSPRIADIKQRLVESRVPTRPRRTILSDLRHLRLMKHVTESLGL